MKKVTVQVLEQWEKLTDYIFFKVLPKQSRFKSNNGLQGNKRYQRIKKYLFIIISLLLSLHKNEVFH